MWRDVGLSQVGSSALFGFSGPNAVVLQKGQFPTKNVDGKLRATAYRIVGRL